MHAEEGLNEYGILSGSRSWYCALDQGFRRWMGGRCHWNFRDCLDRVGGYAVEFIYSNGGPALAPCRSKTRIQGSSGALIAKQWGFTRSKRETSPESKGNRRSSR